MFMVNLYRVMTNEGDYVAVVLSHRKQKEMPQTVYIAAVSTKNVVLFHIKLVIDSLSTNTIS